MTNPSALCLLDWVTIAVFFAVMVAVGAYYGRKAFSSQFFGDDRSVPWWLSGVSFWMNTFSALAFVMYSALAYKFGYVAIALSWVTVPFYFFIGRVIAPRWRRAATKSPIDYVSIRYTPAMCRFMAVLGLPMQLLDNALKLLAIGTVVGVGMGFPLFWAICISGVIILLYTFIDKFNFLLYSFISTLYLISPHCIFIIGVCPFSFSGVAETPYTYFAFIIFKAASYV